MHSAEKVGLFLLAREEGMTIPDAAAFAGVPATTAVRWSRGRLPRSYTGTPRASMGASGRRDRGGDTVARGTYDPPASGPLAGLTPDQIENLLLRAVLADLKAEGWERASISNRSKCELGERLRRATGLPLRCVTGFLRISRSSYEYHRARLGRDRDAAIRAPVREAFGASGGAYGYRRVHAELARRGLRVSEKRVRRVMASEGLVARSTARSPHRYSSYRGEEGRAAAPNLLPGEGTRDSHDFSAARPGERVVTDVTEFRLGKDGPKCYLSAAVDLFDGRVVAAPCSGSPSKALAQRTLGMVASAARPGCVLHSDRGWHYRTRDWVAGCEAAGIVRSMSRRGHSPDNAAMEAFFGRLKVELFHLRDWSGWTAASFSGVVGDYVAWYNSGRLKRFAEGCDTIDGRRRRLGLTA